MNERIVNIFHKLTITFDNKHYINNIFVQGWRRSHRPSLYDISIIDEREEREDPELQEDVETVGNTNSNANKTVFTITN